MGGERVGGSQLAAAVAGRRVETLRNTQTHAPGPTLAARSTSDSALGACRNSRICPILAACRRGKGREGAWAGT